MIPSRLREHCSEWGGAQGNEVVQVMGYGVDPFSGHDPLQRVGKGCEDDGG